MMFQYAVIAMTCAVISKAISPTGDRVRASRDRNELNGYIIRIIISMIPFGIAVYYFLQAIKLFLATG